MKVILAGHNIDIETIKDAKSKGVDPNHLTPETLSAAYARISRSPKPVNELRQIARKEVKAARKSNQNIIFKMGHHSVAEHAVFNFDILGISRLAAEEIERFRLCSYTEKSQRYIKLEDDFVIPQEIEKTGKKQLFIETIKAQNALYHELFADLKDYVFTSNPELAKDKKNHTNLENLAKEDARYTTALATQTQIGHTINARNLELLVRRFASHPLEEIKQLGLEFYKTVSGVAPSIILFTEANDHDRLTYKEVGKLQTTPKKEEQDTEEVNLIHHNPHGDLLTCAALMHTTSSMSFSQCMEQVHNMDQEKRKELIKTSCAHMEFFDQPHREFEYPELTYELVVSAACFAQLKRHRMATMTVQPYRPELGVKVPPAIEAVGKKGKFMEMIKKVDNTYNELKTQSPLAAQYILTNAHRRRVLIKVNARELYHISRLREDAHAQWDIRAIVEKMSALAHQAMPLTMFLLGGKHTYPDLFQKTYGHPPKVPLP